MTLASAWWDYLQTTRWFGGKGRHGRIAKLVRLPAWTAPTTVPTVESLIATVEYADGEREHYHLLAATYPEGRAPLPPVRTYCGVDVIEAAADPVAMQTLADALAVQGMSWLTARPSLGAASVMKGEQSNTNATWGSDAILKIFRKIEPGSNLDAEVLAGLAGSSVSVPALFGRLVADWPTGQRTDLGMVIERVHGAEDGWQLASEACASGIDFSSDARALGMALRGVHGALASSFGTSMLPGDQLAEVMTGRLDTAVGVAPVLQPFAAALASTFDALRGRDLVVQRIHGDFHLGQTLRSASGWTIIDFEGEPAKTAAERRLPDATWRDLAGMLRSFDYARSAHVEPNSAAPRAWARAARTAFLAGYCGSAAAPDDLLAAYESDKAVYEVVYETRNRPDWVQIPLGAVADLAAGNHSSVSSSTGPTPASAGDKE